MFIFHDKVPGKDLNNGIVAQKLGSGERMTVLHWDMDDQSSVPTHTHPHEQFGYIIRGQLDLTLNDETVSLGAGDCYFIPSDAPHMFTAIGPTEAIDVFSPVREELPWME
jgi:quercetin dioxygenase-like cupin family protein